MSICVCECGAYIDSDAEPECFVGEDRVLCGKCRLACPNCEGDGMTRGPERGMREYPCNYCHGTGVVDADEADDWAQMRS